MNSYSNMAMRVLADFRMIRHHENVAGYAQHFDCRAIQPRQYRAGNDFIDSAKRRRAVAEIERAVERGQQWVQLMRAEQDSEMPRLLYAANPGQSEAHRAARAWVRRADIERAAGVAVRRRTIRPARAAQMRLHPSVQALYTPRRAACGSSTASPSGVRSRRSPQNQSRISAGRQARCLFAAHRQWPDDRAQRVGQILEYCPKTVELNPAERVSASFCPRRSALKRQ